MNEDPRDPAVQPERTRMAWRRTTLTFVVVVLLAWRGLAHDGGRGPLLFTASATLLWVVFLLLAHRRIRFLAARRPAGPEPAMVLGSALVVVIVAMLGALLLW
ncbi:DUF202 domain-containing protein [Streptomyces sp. ACA25]|uniref:DUF202 domain-containing protein n=1 Tax=Streptomyces sp. ACA25 TaxID=3022596 RepID=UPI002307CD9E|nr:DUF202 domain-containing protein [Streptomyces sp. ACA25]MDB1089071.1 DUF202 domain-containing protein [Streptomyces sp. ACA25]